MNAMEKVAWTELLVSVAAVGLATLLYPWLGSAAVGSFGILGLIGLSVFFVRRRDQRVVIDERDREIEATAIRFGVVSAWMTLMIVLSLTVVLSSYRDVHTVSLAFLNWLIWIQFAICFGIKGLVAIVLYRRQQHAA